MIYTHAVIQLYGYNLKRPQSSRAGFGRHAVGGGGLIAALLKEIHSPRLFGTVSKARSKANLSHTLKVSRVYCSSRWCQR